MRSRGLVGSVFALRRVRVIAALAALSLLAGVAVWVLGRESPAETYSPVAAPAPTEQELMERALKQAKMTGKKVRVNAVTTERVEVVARPDGMLEEAVSTVPQRVRRGGGWVDVDTALRARADGAYEPKATVPEMRFAGGGSAELATIVQDGHALTFTWPGELPEPTIEGDTAVYADTPVAGADLLIHADADGFSHVIRVRTTEAAAAPEVAQIELGVQGPGLDIVRDDSGVLRAVDVKTGETVLEAAAPVMWDSRQPKTNRVSSTTAAELQVEPGPASQIAPLAAEVGENSLTLTADKDLLASKDLKLPAYIDPSWRAPGELSAVMVNTDYATDASWTTMGMGLCDENAAYMKASNVTCGGDGVVLKRLFYNFEPSPYLSQDVIRAEVEFRETWAYSCTASAVELWATKKATSSTSWSAQNSDGWEAGFNRKVIMSKSFAYGNEGLGCNDSNVEFNNEVLWQFLQNQFNDKADPVISFGLRAGNEGSVSGWKKFDRDATLRMVVNLPPNKPALQDLRTHNGTAYTDSCAAQADPQFITGRPAGFQMRLSDPNSTDLLQGEVEVSWDAGDGKGWAPHIEQLMTNKALEREDGTQTVFTAALTSAQRNSIPLNTVIGWRAKAWDYKDFTTDAGKVVGVNFDNWYTPGETLSSSDWSNKDSHSCFFKIDTEAPAPPKVEPLNGVYPVPPAGQEDTYWYGGPGVTGTFKVSPASASDIPNHYSVRLVPDWAQPKDYAAGAGGVTVLNDITPVTAGVKTVEVSAVDSAGRVSTRTTFTFRVHKPSEYAAYWKLDEPESSPIALDTDATSDDLMILGTGDAALGSQGKLGTALRVNTDDDAATTGWAQTADPVVDASKSYSVAAWVKLSDTKGWYAAVSQDGTAQSSFYLQYTNTYNKWSMAAGGTRAFSTTTPTAGKWTHLIGVYDKEAGKVRIYVNGTPEGSQPIIAPWNGPDGPLAVGRGKWNGVNADLFSGTIDDVRVLPGAITDADAKKYFYKTVSARWPLNTASGGISPDDLVSPLTLAGNAKIGTSTDDCGLRKVGSGCLVLDGDGDYAATQGPVVTTVDTTAPAGDQQRSFTVAGFARLSAKPNRPMAVFSQSGEATDAFVVRFNPSALDGAGAWELVVPGSDSTGAALTTVEHRQCNACDGQTQHPDHLAIVYDEQNGAEADTLRLYVNGRLSAETYVGTDTSISSTDGSGPIPVIASTKPFRIGTTKLSGTLGEFFAGSIDDVWVYQGALDEDQIIELANGTELRREDAP